VVLQRLRLVLRKNENLTDVGVDTVADGEVDQTIAAREAIGRLGAVDGEGKRGVSSSSVRIQADGARVEGQGVEAAGSVAVPMGCRRATSVSRSATWGRFGAGSRAL
jgi:hypothetical protein